MRIGIAGYGAVAAIHAKGSHRWGADLRVIYGPKEEKARVFAAANRVPGFTTDFETALAGCDAVIVASPSDCHFGQARAVLRARRHCLVELPACFSASEARELLRAAADAKVTLQCAHTTRYLKPIMQLACWLAANELGDIRHVLSVRAIPPRTRSWVDHAVLHHAAHHVDLLLQWFGALQPVACMMLPGSDHPQDAVLAAYLENGAPVNLSVSYTCRLRETRITIVGSAHTVTTDGFSVIQSDNPVFGWRGDEQASYESAVETQDRAFVEACSGDKAGVPWEDTIRLAECLDRFLELGGKE